MAGKVSLQGFVATHRDSGTMGGCGRVGGERGKASRAISTPHEPRQCRVRGYAFCGFQYGAHYTVQK